MTAQSNYNSEENSDYGFFENANGLITNDIAYSVTGRLAFTSIREYFTDTLRICDVGCFHGGTTMRWHTQSLAYGKAHVLGTDIYQANIDIASRAFPQLNFQLLQRGNAIPLINSQQYHLIFATFVIDTISEFNDVEILCYNMLNSLEAKGMIFLLRLHPNALKSKLRFKEYGLNTKSDWHHGDTLTISLNRNTGQQLVIHDFFWTPEKIADIFSKNACSVELLSLSLHEKSVSSFLVEEINKANLETSMPEWNEPLYQIIKIQKL